MEEDEYYESLSKAGWDCLFYYKQDPEFHNDDPCDFINPNDVARHVHSILKFWGVDFRGSMNEAEQTEFNKINR